MIGESATTDYATKMIAQPSVPMADKETTEQRKARLLKQMIEAAKAEGCFDRPPRVGISGKELTRAEFIRRILDIAERYTFQAPTKPVGWEDVCWNEIQEPPQGGLANTYEDHEGVHIIVTGPRPPAYWDEEYELTVVPAAPTCMLHITYVSDLNG